MFTSNIEPVKHIPLNWLKSFEESLKKFQVDYRFVSNFTHISAAFVLIISRKIYADINTESI